MKKYIHYIIIGVASLLTFTACDVHEFPEPNQELVPFLLHLDFDTEMPIYDIITRNGESETKAQASKYDVRYTINAYRTEKARTESRQPDATFIFTKSNVNELNYTAALELPEGTYTFRVWADYVDAESKEDKYYNTQNFEEIILADRENHPGSNDYRDAFRGYATSEVTNTATLRGAILQSVENEITVEMKRPMGKFKVISTDVEMFLGRVALLMKEQGLLPGIDVETKTGLDADTKAYYEQLLQSINLGYYSVIFRYNAFMPCSFNMFTDRPADSWTGVSFVSPMFIEGEYEMNMGYDYIFVNGSETTVNVSIEVRNKAGELIASSIPFDVPIVRSKLTIVKGNFLTTKATGGVSINPGYEGKDFDIDITIR